jgi:hypothetical protein
MPPLQAKLAGWYRVVGDEVPGPGHYRVNHALQDNHAHSRSPNLAWGPTRPQSAPLVTSSSSRDYQPDSEQPSIAVSKTALLTSGKGTQEGNSTDSTAAAATTGGEGIALDDLEGAETRETVHTWGLKPQPVHPKQAQRRPGSACFMAVGREQQQRVTTERPCASASHHKYYHPGYDNLTRPASGAIGPR